MNTSLAGSATEGSNRIENWPVDDVSLGLNIGGALFLGALLDVLRNWASIKPANDSTYFSLRSMYRVIDFLGLQSQNPVATGVLRREFPTSSEQLGADIFVIVTWLGIAAAATLLLSLLRNTRIYRAIVGPAALTILLFAAPVCYLYVSWRTWGWMHEPGRKIGNFFLSIPLTVFLVEIVCFSIFWRLFRRKQKPKSLKGLLVSLHFMFWTFVLWAETRESLYPINARGLILLMLPLSTLMYVLRKERVLRGSEMATQSRKSAWTLAFAAIVLVTVVIVWRPARVIELTHSQNVDSSTVQLSRGPCYGSCTAYTITVHGNGQVEYGELQGYSRIQTKKSGTIGREKFSHILQLLDGVEFTALESRAFTWGFDTSSIGVYTSVDGRTKQVVSDGEFVGAPGGRQARFVKAAREIDSILASSTWLKCEGNCNSSASSP